MSDVEHLTVRYSMGNHLANLQLLDSPETIA
jgi:hypothetical protein